MFSYLTSFSGESKSKKSNFNCIVENVSSSIAGVSAVTSQNMPFPLLWKCTERPIPSSKVWADHTRLLASAKSWSYFWCIDTSQIRCRGSSLDAARLEHRIYRIKDPKNAVFNFAKFPVLLNNLWLPSTSLNWVLTVFLPTDCCLSNCHSYMFGSERN